MFRKKLLFIALAIMFALLLLSVRAVLESTGHSDDQSQATNSMDNSYSGEYKPMTDDERLQAVEVNHRLIVSAATLYMANNDGAMPPNAAAFDEFMHIPFAELNGPSGSASAQPTGAQYTFNSITDAQGHTITITITAELDGQIVATWTP